MNRISKPVAFLLFVLALGLCGGAWAANTLRPQVGKPLQAAQALMKEQKYKDALEKIKEADAVPNKTPYETTVVEQMRGSAAASAGDLDTAAKSFDAVFAAKALPAADELKIMQAMAGSYYRAKEYAKAEAWADRYQKAGGSDPSIGLLVVQSQYMGGNFAGAAKGMQDVLAAEEKAGKSPSEEQLQLLASCYLKQNDGAGYQSALEKLVAYYPKKDYWADLLSRVQRKPGFSDRLGLDVYRLMQLTGTLSSPGEYMEMAELALQAGYPKEAQKVLDQGYAGKVLGSGAEADRQKRLKAMADKQTAEDQKALGTEQAKSADAQVNTGFNLVINGQNDKGLGLMQQGIAAGSLKHPDEARLHLGVAYQLAGHNDEAVKAFKAVQGKDGSQDLARLYVLVMQSGKGGGRSGGR
jgi:hypothetical protein